MPVFTRAIFSMNSHVKHIHVHVYRLATDKQMLDFTYEIYYVFFCGSLDIKGLKSPRQTV